MGSLHVRGLGKAYKRYADKKGRLMEWLGARPRHELRWVLRDVSFDVRPGESVGIVGSNGAGKSTLLKLIAGTAQPTEGTVQVGGSVSALLELGIGFHPDFTGRENVFMAGSIRGFPPDMIVALMDEIEGFAEIGDYIDQPARTYSSGMMVRLAFSIATVVRPEILIVDEALSVGDIYFQQKCFERIREFRDAGTTLLFVSHALSTVYALCSRAIFLENGRVQLDGEPKEVLDLYQARIVARSSRGAAPLAVVAPPAPAPPPAPPPDPVAQVESVVEPAAATPQPQAPAEPALATGSYYSEGVTIHSVVLRDTRGGASDVFLSDQTIVVEVMGGFDRAVEDPHFGFQVRDRLGQALFMTTTHGQGASIGPVKPGDARTVRFRFTPRIAPGDYTVTAGIANIGRIDGTFEESLVRHHDAAAFTVVQAADAKRWAGMIDLRPSVEIVAAATDAAGHD